ncbi:MAG: SDR family NAD(P)-dependent oxidoreductase, partial [Enterocloster bolteae]
MKTALVTGASRGIGLAIARELGVNGYQVAVMATRGESFYPESTRTLRDAGISYAWYAGDIGKSEDRIRIVREAAEHFGEIHVLVNNAGVAPKVRTDLLDMTEESFDYVIG